MISPSQRIEMSVSTASSSSFGKRSIKSCLRHRCACGKIVIPEDDLDESERIQIRYAQQSTCSMSSITRERDAKKRCRECKFKYEHGHNLVVPPTEISIDRKPNNTYNNVLYSPKDSPRTFENASDFLSNTSSNNEPNQRLRGISQISASIAEDVVPEKKQHISPGQEFGSDQLGKIGNSQSETFIFDPFNLGDCQPLHFENSVSQSSPSASLQPAIPAIRKQQGSGSVNKHIPNFGVDSDDDGMSDNILRALSDDSDALDSVQLLASIDITTKNSSSPKSIQNGQNTNFALQGFDDHECSDRQHLVQQNQSNNNNNNKIKRWNGKKERFVLRPRCQQRDVSLGDLRPSVHDLSYNDCERNQINRPEDKITNGTGNKNNLVPSSEVATSKHPHQSCTMSETPVSESSSPDLSIKSRISNSKFNQQKSKSRPRPQVSLFDKGSDDGDEMRDEMPSVIIRVNANDGSSMIRQGINPTQSSDPDIMDRRNFEQQNATTTEIRTVEASKPLISWDAMMVNPCLSLRSCVSAVSDAYE